MDGMLFLMAGCFDDPDQLEPAMAVYTARGAHWDALDPTLVIFPGMPPQVPEQG
jgi:hypothetical protein